MGDFSKFIPITKVDAEKREVYGILAEQVLDKTKEVFDYEGSKPYFQKWNADFTALTNHLNEPSVGNMREMHGKKVAGKFIRMEYDDAAKTIYAVGKVIDNEAWEKVQQGVYTGYSIGGDYVKRFDDPTTPGAKRYIASPTEGSLVDNPCMYGATFEMVKADGHCELVKFTGAPGVPDGYTLPTGKDGKPVSSTRSKTVGGEELHDTDFAVVPDLHDESTWALPINNADRVKQSMLDFSNIELPLGNRGHVARRIAAAAYSHNIDPSGFVHQYVKSYLPEFEKVLLKPAITVVPTEKGPGNPALQSVRKGVAKMEATTIDQLKKSFEGATTLEDVKSITTELIKFHEETLAKVKNSFATACKGVDAMQEANEEMGEHLDELDKHMGKSGVEPLHKIFKGVRSQHEKMKSHLDKVSGAIDEMGAQMDTDTRAQLRGKSDGARELRKMQREYQVKMDEQQTGFETLMAKFIDAIAGPATVPNAVVQKPARMVTVEKSADVNGAGGLVVAKPLGGAPVIEIEGKSISPVDMYGMPNPEFLKSAESKGSGFVKSVASVKAQKGDPFPKEFGNSTVF